AGERVQVETYLREYPELAGDRQVHLSLVLEEARLHGNLDSDAALEDYQQRFPDLTRELQDSWNGRQTTEAITIGEKDGLAGAEPRMTARLSSATEPEGPAEPKPPAAETSLPEQIGRFRVEGILGKGGFGVVYLAYDDQLQRRVAIKVPHAD